VKADAEYQQKLDDQNRRAMVDSIKVEFNKKLNAYDFSKQSFVVNKLADLEKYNKQLYDELSKVKGDIMSAIDTKLKIDMPKLTLGNKLEILNKDSGYYGLRFSNTYADLGLKQKLSGSSRFIVNMDQKKKEWVISPKNTIIDTNQIELSVTYGTRAKDKGYEVFAESKSPLVKFTELNGAYFVENQVLKPVSPKKWGIGPYIGFGLNTDYNLANPRFGWSIGFSLHYDLLQWRFGKK
jgi:hypothetical protein